MTNTDSTESALRRAKRPRSVIAGPYGHPFHALLVTIPIGAWVASLVFDIVAAVGEDPEAFRAGASLLIAIGIIGAVVAASVGLLDLTTLSAGTRVRKIALTHMGLNVGVIILFAVSLILRQVGGVDEASVAGVVLSVLGLLLLGGSGFLGGEMAYRYGVRVADEDTQRAGFER
jgi:uncharacterized membrane protein